MYSVIFPSASRLRGSLSIEEVANFIFELAQEKNVPNYPSVSDSKIAHIGIGRSPSKK